MTPPTDIIGVVKQIKQNCKIIDGMPKEPVTIKHEVFQSIAKALEIAVQGLDDIAQGRSTTMDREELKSKAKDTIALIRSL